MTNEDYINFLLISGKLKDLHDINNLESLYNTNVSIEKYIKFFYNESENVLKKAVNVCGTMACEEGFCTYIDKLVTINKDIKEILGMKGVLDRLNTVNVLLGYKERRLSINDALNFLKLIYMRDGVVINLNKETIKSNKGKLIIKNDRLDVIYKDTTKIYKCYCDSTDDKVNLVIKLLKNDRNRFVIKSFELTDINKLVIQYKLWG